MSDESRDWLYTCDFLWVSCVVNVHQLKQLLTQRVGGHRRVILVLAWYLAAKWCGHMRIQEFEKVFYNHIQCCDNFKNQQMLLASTLIQIAEVAFIGSATWWFPHTVYWYYSPCYIKYVLLHLLHSSVNAEIRTSVNPQPVYGSDQVFTWAPVPAAGLWVLSPQLRWAWPRPAASDPGQDLAAPATCLKRTDRLGNSGSVVSTHNADSQYCNERKHFKYTNSTTWMSPHLWVFQHYLCVWGESDCTVAHQSSPDLPHPFLFKTLTLQCLQMPCCTTLSLSNERLYRWLWPLGNFLVHIFVINIETTSTKCVQNNVSKDKDFSTVTVVVLFTLCLSLTCGCVII